MLQETIDRGLAAQIRRAFAGPRPEDACAVAMAQPRKLLLRFPTGPSPCEASPGRANLTGQSVLEAVHTLLLFLDVDPDVAFGRIVEAGGDHLALMLAPPDRPAHHARVGAFILAGLSELELNLALAWWADYAAKRNPRADA